MRDVEEESWVGIVIGCFLRELSERHDAAGSLGVRDEPCLAFRAFYPAHHATDMSTRTRVLRRGEDARVHLSPDLMCLHGVDLPSVSWVRMRYQQRSIFRERLRTVEPACADDPQTVFCAALQVPLHGDRGDVSALTVAEAITARTDEGWGSGVVVGYSDDALVLFRVAGELCVEVEPVLAVRLDTVRARREISAHDVNRSRSVYGKL